ncbi:MAG: phosphate uptake regulator PhoU [Candidatus Methanosuratincola petrocarbonis]
MEEPSYLKEINSGISEMYSSIVEIYGDVLSALEEPAVGKTKEICEKTKSVMEQEEAVIDRCVEALIRHQPFAGDLRAVTSAMRVSYDLARISRYLSNIVQVIDDVNSGVRCAPDVRGLLESGWEMIQESVKSYLSKDPIRAASVIEEDAKIDEGYRKVLARYRDYAEGGACVLMNGLIARIIERMADHACYISAETVYMVTGSRIGVRAPKCPSEHYHP